MDRNEIIASPEWEEIGRRAPEGVVMVTDALRLGNLRLDPETFPDSRLTAV